MTGQQGNISTEKLLEYAQHLLRVPSVCPADNGAVDALIGILAPLGFQCEKLVFSGGGGPETVNLWATRPGKILAKSDKSPGPHFCFAGHTDVVPAGDVAAWRHDPFGGVVENGVLYGRGAVDMKGAIAAFVAAAAAVPDHAGTLSLLITGNEEGDCRNGTPRVLEWLKTKNIKIDHCLVGEPTSEGRIGDVLKNGRRGSFSAHLTVRGVQGHVAYPQRALNANHLLAQILARLSAQKLDEGNRDFPPSTLQITDMKTEGEVAVNLVPAAASAALNIRYNNSQSHELLERWLRRECDAVILPVTGGAYELNVWNSADAFLTPPGDFVQLVSEAVMQQTKSIVTLSTSGGTSDARFIKNICPVVELGLRNATAHQVDECVPVEDLRQLCEIYASVLRRYFAEMKSEQPRIL